MHGDGREDWLGVHLQCVSEIGTCGGVSTVTGGSVETILWCRKFKKNSFIWSGMKGGIWEDE